MVAAALQSTAWPLRRTVTDTTAPGEVHVTLKGAIVANRQTVLTGSREIDTSIKHDQNSGSIERKRSSCKLRAKVSRAENLRRLGGPARLSAITARCSSPGEWIIRFDDSTLLEAWPSDAVDVSGRSSMSNYIQSADDWTPTLHQFGWGMVGLKGVD